MGWALLMFLPTWRPTRALADSAFFPIFIAILYASGIGALICLGIWALAALRAVVAWAAVRHVVPAQTA